MRAMKRAFTGGAVVAAVSIAVALVAFLPAGGFFSGDAGAKLLQAQAFADCDGPPCEIPYRARAIDPDFALRPSYTTPGREGLVSLFPYLYPVAGAALDPLFGARSLRAVSAVAALLAALVAGVLATGDRRRPGGAAAVVLLATPLVFYGAAVWEHALAALLVVAAVAACWPRAGRADGGAPGGPVVAGLLFGLAFWVRTEAILYALGLLATPGLGRRARLAVWGRLGAGMAAGLALGAAGQRLLLGRWLPFHLASNPSAGAALDGGFLTSRLRGFGELFAPDPATALAAAAWFVAMVAAVLLRHRRHAVLRVTGAALAAGGLAAFVAPVLRVLSGGAGLAESFPLRTVTAVWLFGYALPLLHLVEPEDRHERARDELLFNAALAPVVVYWLVSPLPGGYQWGGRYFLPTAVLLAALVWRIVCRAAARGDRAVAALGAAAFGASVLVQGLGLALLFHVSAGNARLCEAIAARTAPGRPVVCATRWLPEILAPVWDERLVVLAGDDPDRLAGLLTDAGAGAVDAFTVLGEGSAPLPGPPSCRVVGEDTIVTPGRQTRHTLLDCRPSSGVGDG